MRSVHYLFLLILVTFLAVSCRHKKVEKPAVVENIELKDSALFKRYNKYIIMNLTTDMGNLTTREKKMLGFLIDAAKIMDNLFWMQALGNKEELMKYLDYTQDDNLKSFGLVNYGPWDRLDNNVPFIGFCGNKPAGANFYPVNMTKEEFENLSDSLKKNPYTMIRRNNNGALQVIWYHEIFRTELNKAAELILKAASFSDDGGLKNYLKLRAGALLSDQYTESDVAWLNMKSNRIDFIAGPIENYEDRLFGYKTSYEAYVLIKDREWSGKLTKYLSFLPELQKSLPLPDKYRFLVPGSNSDLSVYDIIYYAGDCNAGSKTIAVNLPNDPEIQKNFGTRRLQLKNAIKAKFDKILIPIANIMIDPSQRSNVKFDAFFYNTMFHEVAHGLGVKYTLTGKKITEALKEYHGTLEEAKADIVGLYLITRLNSTGELPDSNIMDYYVTFAASIFRSVRFGSSDAHGKANLARLNYFLDNGALIRNENGTYKVDFNKMKEAITSLSSLILNLQLEGNYNSVKEWIDKEGTLKIRTGNDLDQLKNEGIPVDVIFIQGKEILGI